MDIPYGLSVGTWVIHIAENCTRMFFPPYGNISLGPFRTTLLLSTVRVCNEHRTVCSFSGFLMMYLPTSRPYYKTKLSWPASTWHWSHLAFRRSSPQWLLIHQYTHTARDFHPKFYNRTVLLFLFFAYRTGCKNLKNQISPQGTNLRHSRKKFYLLNQLCSFRCAQNVKKNMLMHRS